MLTTEEIKAILKPQFGLLGKGGEFKAEPLWVHAFTLWSIASKIINFIPRFDDRERRLLEITVLIHDIGKMTEKNQTILSGEIEGRVRHTQTKEQIKIYFVDYDLLGQLTLSEDDIDFIYHAHFHHNLPEDALKTAPPSLAVYADIVRYADWLASMERLDRKRIQDISTKLEPFCQITAVHISRPEGPSNYLLFDIAYKTYKEMGWNALIVLPDSLLLIAPKGTPYPAKKDVVKKFQETLIRNSLSLQKPNPTNFAAVLLAGESSKNPRLYLEIHQDYLRDALGDFDRSPSFFFKLLIEMLDNSGKLTTDIKKDYPILDILKGLCGTRGIPIARKKWTEMGGKVTEPLKDMLKEIFMAISLTKILPANILNTEEPERDLKKITADELFRILILLADKLFPETDKDLLMEELEFLITMEEEIDFREVALKRFKKYKEYKSTQNPEHGICESCGFTQAFPTQKSLNFPGGKRWGFSQISAHTDSARATCTLCAYDTMVFRGDISESRTPVYIRIEAKTADIWQLYDEIAKLVQKLDASYYNPYTLETLEKRQEYGFLPLPPNKIKMPQLKEPKYISQPLTSVRGYIIPVSRVENSESPKDLRARYLSLYALLKMMGFDTHIGFEEQNGLFGDNPIARHGEDYESLYYRGLAIKYFANFLGGEKKEKQNAHVLAESILTKSPSVAVTKIREAAEDNKRRNKLTGEQLRYIIESIVKGNFTLKKAINGGEYTMKDLLKHAAFFADKEKGIGHFCVEPEKRGDFWNPINMTRHNTAKPVSDALDEIMQGREIDMAMERFMRNIAKKIGQDEQDKLADFVKGAKDVFRKYHELRKVDISEFIKVKNALTSAIYLLTRYEKLNIKEVVNG